MFFWQKWTFKNEYCIFQQIIKNNRVRQMKRKVTWPRSWITEKWRMNNWIMKFKFFEFWTVFLKVKRYSTFFVHNWKMSWKTKTEFYLEPSLIPVLNGRRDYGRYTHSHSFQCQVSVWKTSSGKETNLAKIQPENLSSERVYFEWIHKFYDSIHALSNLGLTHNLWINSSTTAYTSKLK